MVEKTPTSGDTEKWDCKRCGAVLNFVTCKWTRTNVIERGRQYARAQPETNLRLVASARLNGINMKQATEFLGGMGIQCPRYKNVAHAELKIREAIDELADERIEENLRKHAAAVRISEGYKGDLKFYCKKEGKWYKICRGAACMDGAGLTRAYSHRIRGSQAVLVVWSLVINLPIMVIWHHVSAFSNIELTISPYHFSTL